jgi:hypothetical protein
MTDSPRAFVHEAELRLEPETDPAAVGAAVTTELCGHWEHEGPCRWPHNNAIDADEEAAGFRTLFVAPAGDESEVRDRIERALRDRPGWVVVETRARPVSPGEEPLAERLAAPAQSDA